jgi:hypothetical protein
MTERRGSRFLIEVLFLVALAGALTLAHLSAVQIAGIMLLGWIVVAALEWAAWRGEPHYGSGLPPRYYVPSVNLPPAQPLEQVAVGGYPDASRDEAPTWIASAALREEMLGEWPVAAHVADSPVDEVTEEELDAELVVPLPPAPVLVEPPVSQPAAVAPAPVPPAPVAPAPLPPAAEPTIDVVLARSAQRVARYSLDPLAEPAPKRRFGRGDGDGQPPAVEVPARPEGIRVLPGHANSQD